ncbi:MULTISPECIES: ArsC family reductase [unclassified Oceanobacter]|uniref:ArsC family reductase n=1 Tax=unclassified Oceanobacter TaxID=2620260 RepID=UPI0026E13AE3|nr:MULTISPECIES: ArsC family reductase [unclassified Oceanobacter]MDO6682179.1 ArsC family reductase [Oceanobacter sp. 5_MG-2023]MDP2610557.1 ArsC family reductase [Oceanobacter sp. 1_MG-2023]MDP2613834.1 ArsC family reductase [Oceanobacter sp. 2_MG-2023]
MITMYGIKNCDTIKKARSWLDQAAIEFTFHDYKKDGLDPALVDQWLDELGWEALINKRGTTWRALPDDLKTRMDNASARQAMLENPSIIKRPLLDTGSQKLLGFKPDTYAALFNQPPATQTD